MYLFLGAIVGFTYCADIQGLKGAVLFFKYMFLWPFYKPTGTAHTRLQVICMRILEVDTEYLMPTAYLVRDLGMNSQKSVALRDAIQVEFLIVISDLQWGRCFTYGDLLRLIQAEQS